VGVAIYKDIAPTGLALVGVAIYKDVAPTGNAVNHFETVKNGVYVILRI
jgi:hypothetical protein